MSFDTFRQIIKKPETCGNRRRFEFLETDKNSKLKKVEIMGFTTENAIKFSFDGKKELSPYLSHSGNHLKACDAVLLAEIDDQNYLLFIEMKSESIDKDRMRACYQHACLRYVSNNQMTNVIVDPKNATMC